MTDKIKSIKETHKKMIVCFIFALILITGMSVRGDYGAYVDYAPQTEVIFMNIQGYAKLFLGEDSGYVRGLGDRDILTDGSRDYGEAALYAIIPFSMIPKFRNDPHLWMMTLRAVVFSVFWIGLICLYLLTKKLTKRRLYGLISVFLMWLTPRFFAEGTFNNKDSVNLACCSILAYAGYEFISNKKHEVLWTILFAYAAALATNERITGIILYGVIGLSFLLIIIIRKEVNARNLIKGFSAIILSVIFYVIITPASWYGNLISLFMYRLNQSAEFERTAVEVIMNGKVFNTVICPPGISYVFIYMAISIPPLILITFFAGIITTITKVSKKPDNETYYRFVLLSFVIILLLTVLVGKPILYNGWRQLEFIYPFMIIFSVLGIYDLSEKSKNVRLVLATFTTIQLVFLAGFICLNHPLEFSYYNFLAGDNTTDDWEGDYWGVGCGYVMKWVAKYRGECNIVSATPFILNLNYEQFTEEEKAQMILGGDDWASTLRSDYIIVNTDYKKIAQKKVDADWSPFTEADVALYNALDQETPVKVFKCGHQVLYEVYANPYKE